jgi:hypothetical protein
MTTVTKAIPVVFEIAEIDARALDVARVKMVDTATSTGQVIQGYADSMTIAFGAAWYDAKGSLGKAVKVERAEFKAAMISGGFEVTTIDVYWGRVKVAAGYVTAGNKAKGTATLDSKTLSELKTILNRIMDTDPDEEGAELSNQAKASLIDALETMGGSMEKDLTK